MEVRPRGPSIHANRDHLAISRYANPLYRWKGRRLDPPNLGAQVLYRPLAHLLADYISCRGDAERHMPATLALTTVEPRAAARPPPGRYAACVRRPMASSSRGMTSVAISSIERFDRAGSTQSWPA